jgi:prepilin-type N-terminal cleavage/methylation domain-containing protein
MGRRLLKKQAGFTIIELLFATVVFSVLLIIMLVAFMRIGDLFYKGVSMSKTQEDARNVVQSVSDDLQFTKSALQNPSGRYCIGVHRYLYNLGVQVDPSSGNYGIQRDNQGTICPTAAMSPCTTVSGCTNMLDTNMQVNLFNISCSSVGLCDVKIHLVFYGGDPSKLFTGSTLPYYKATNAQCNGSLSDTSLCATVDYDSTVLKNT